VIDRKLALAESGAQPWLVKRGSSNNFGRYPDEVVEQARSLRAKSMTYTAVSEKMGVPLATIKAWCKGRSRKQPSTPGWTREVAIEAIRHFAVELDVKSDKRLPTIKTIRRLFGCWSAALKAAGMRGESPQQWTREAVLDAFRSAAERQGHWPSHKELRAPDSGLPGNTALKRLFGTTSLKRIQALAVGGS
jgi:transcriptional regulator with XRE-family HTH domain